MTTCAPGRPTTCARPTSRRCRRAIVCPDATSSTAARARPPTGRGRPRARLQKAPRSSPSESAPDTGAPRPPRRVPRPAAPGPRSLTESPVPSFTRHSGRQMRASSRRRHSVPSSGAADWRAAWRAVRRGDTSPDHLRAGARRHARCGLLSPRGGADAEAGRRPGSGAHAFPVDRSLHAPADGRGARPVRQSPEARRRDDRARRRRGDREPPSRFQGRRRRAERVRLARACRPRRPGTAQAAGRPEAALAQPRHRRPVGRDGHGRSRRYRGDQGRRDGRRLGGGRRSRQRRRPDRAHQGLPRHRHRRRRARSAATSLPTSASTTASTTRRARSGRRSPRPRPKASTSISTTSAATSWMPCCRAST